MASPQKENGYTKIANELYDAIARWHLSSYESRVLIFIIRKTYGWNKKSDWISLSQFVEATGIRESHVSRTISLLVKQKIVTKGGKRREPMYSVQKNYSLWEVLPKGVRSHHTVITKGGKSKLPKGVLPKGVITITKGGNSMMKKGGDTKDNNSTKETVTKEIKVPEGTLTSQEWENLIDIWKPVDKFYTRFYRRKTDRGAIQEIVKNVGQKQYLMVVKMLSATNKINYFPKINTPCQLRDKWSALEDAWVRKKREMNGSDKVDNQQVDRFPTK